MIKLYCRCGQSIKYSREDEDKTIECRWCKQPLRLPTIEQLEPELRKKFLAQEQRVLKRKQRKQDREEQQIRKKKIEATWLNAKLASEKAETYKNNIELVSARRTEARNKKQKRATRRTSEIRGSNKVIVTCLKCGKTWTPGG